MGEREDLIGRKTLIAVLASHDRIVKDNELARIFEKLYFQEEGVPDNEKLFVKFHFIFETYS
jgi:hypothetical protein